MSDSTILTRYMAKPLLSKEEEIKYIKLYKEENDLSARDILVTRNLRLVVSIAKNYKLKNSSLSFDDIFQEGVIGLIEGIERFNLEKNCRISTYVSWWIQQSILKCLNTKDKVVRKPTYISNILSKKSSIEKDFKKKHNCLPSQEELAALIGISINKLKHAIKHSNIVMSSLSVDDTLKELDIAKKFEQTPEELLSSKELEEITKTALGTLSEREKTVLQMRFGID